eukprot:m.309727 g.309727  ORF g.309727 m.309727 type:complete len:136 (+) comp47502_c0_seq1:42-449(+)
MAANQKSASSDSADPQVINNYLQSKTRIKSLLNATAISQNIALLVSVLKDGEKQSFYLALVIMLFISLAIQVSLSLAIVWYQTVGVKELNSQHKEHYLKMHAVMMMVTTVSLILNIGVNTVFSARSPHSTGKPEL